MKFLIKIHSYRQLFGAAILIIFVETVKHIFGMKFPKNIFEKGSFLGQQF
jgi:hypothetical protein